ncbi:tRNA pseudouridine(38/39) synthase-like isoform X2 [Herrania umbratica]|uniref:tRNA pseudouridine(38/39) synthase-like isoform X2 n=1 Tax=Herrania umbratica TaxID=108875 RepID=A0A6J1AEQ0_9ROSI|nr:tRNA pseudouridine(38/39) synthase-like isoform X2 [Herrania umbratica]
MIRPEKESIRKNSSLQMDDKARSPLCTSSIWFYGFASEAQMDPTVESEIFKALGKTRLLVGDKKESHYSRCGRTDKGVSTVGQCIAKAA